MSNRKAWLWATGIVLGALLVLGAFIFAVSNAPTTTLIVFGVGLVVFAIKGLKNIIKDGNTGWPT